MEDRRGRGPSGPGVENSTVNFLIIQLDATVAGLGSITDDSLRVPFFADLRQLHARNLFCMLLPFKSSLSGQTDKPNPFDAIVIEAARTVADEGTKRNGGEPYLVDTEVVPLVLDHLQAISINPTEIVDERWEAPRFLELVNQMTALYFSEQDAAQRIAAAAAPPARRRKVINFRGSTHRRSA
jgi:hypothetical protein